MKPLLKIIYSAVPYLAVEVLQYTLLSVIIYIKSLTPMSEDLLYLLAVSITAVSGMVFFFWYRYMIAGEVGGEGRFSFNLKHIILFIPLGIGCQFFFSGVMALIKPYFENTFSDYTNVLENLTSGNQVIVLVFMILIAPVSEEIIFRGVILHRAGKVFPFFYANILQAVFFGIYHGNPVQGIYAFLIGLLLGAIYSKFRSVLAPVLLHIIINASSLLMVLIPDQIISYIIILLFGGGFITVSLVLLDLVRPSSNHIR